MQRKSSVRPSNAECIYVKSDGSGLALEESKRNRQHVESRARQNDFTFLALMNKISAVQKRMMAKNDEFTRIMLFLNKLSLTFADAHEKESKEIRDILAQATVFAQTTGVNEIDSNKKYLETMTNLTKVMEDKVNPKALYGALKDLYEIYQNAYEDTEGFGRTLRNIIAHQSPTVSPGYPIVYHMNPSPPFPTFQPAFYPSNPPQMIPMQAPFLSQPPIASSVAHENKPASVPETDKGKVSATHIGGKPKKVKKWDKDHPKKPLSSFFCYQKSRRGGLIKEHPELTTKQIVGKMSEEWRGMDEKDREPYEKLAQKEIERYEASMKIYKEKKDLKSKK